MAFGGLKFLKLVTRILEAALGRSETFSAPQG